MENQARLEAEKLLSKMSIESAIYFCEELGSRLPNINLTPPVHREADDRYMQFWKFGVVDALNKANL